MKTVIASLCIPLFLFSISACLEDANSPVGPVAKPNDEGAAGDDENHLELMALTYKGEDIDEANCFLHVSAFDIEHNGEVHREFVAKVDYKIHGQNFADTEVKLRRYKSGARTYLPIDSTEAGTIPSMISIVLKDKSIDVDFNKADEYEQTGQLSQFLRADFKDMDFQVFENALEEVLADNSQFSANKSKLNQLQKTLLKIDHNGHTDKANCSVFELVSMSKVEFELDGDHEDHGDHGDHEDHDDHGDHEGHDDDHDQHKH